MWPDLCNILYIFVCDEMCKLKNKSSGSIRYFEMLTL